MGLDDSCWHGAFCRVPFIGLIDESNPMFKYISQRMSYQYAR